MATDGDRTAVWLSGEHDLASTVLLTTALAEAIAVEDDDIVVDMSFLAFMDVTTLGLLLRSHEFLVTRGRRLTLRAPPRCATLLLDVSELGVLVESAATGGGSEHWGATALGTWVAVPQAERAPPVAQPDDERNDPDVARPMSEP